ncbi:hypothetical protein [Novosphingobium pituita]|nr:hypothetical protein [Novosphingobium sp. IK01]
MRVALIALMDNTAGDGSDEAGFDGGGQVVGHSGFSAPGFMAPGFLDVAGHSIARHQVALALALGCTRIVVHAETLDPEIVEIQHAAEQRGARFHVIAAARALVPLVSPEDELFVFAEGLLAMPDEARRLLDEAPGVLVLPVEIGTPAGFERIDINHAWAGAMRLSGRVVAMLGDLPSDWNPVAALLRLATQARLPLRAVPGVLVDQGRWRLVRTEQEADLAENDWLVLHTATDHVRSPGEWLAVKAVRRLGPALLHAHTRPWLVGMAAVLLALLGLGAGWWGWTALGLALVGLGWVVLQVARLLGRVERDCLLVTGGPVRGGGMLPFVIDAALVGVCAWHGLGHGLEHGPGGSTGGDPAQAGGWFAPLVLILLLWLLPAILRGFRWTAWLCDRLVLAGGLALVAMVLPLDGALRIVDVLLLATALGQAHGLIPNRLLTSGT